MEVPVLEGIEPRRSVRGAIINMSAHVRQENEHVHLRGKRGGHGEEGTTGEDDLWADAKADPQDVKAGEAADSLGGEGGSVVGADGIGQAELTEDPFE